MLTLAGAATFGAVPWWAALTLRILFAAGMSAFDTTQGAVIRRAYSWQPGRRRLGPIFVALRAGDIFSHDAFDQLSPRRIVAVLAMLMTSEPMWSVYSPGS
ncbi:hypothetical protein MRBLWS13_001601 [Microbacterium sp. LWS13-1.2]|uniref:Uncharacterized protein n=1 Tax=Microbacterium sp. LWS13-1.2 TaxID=3135264 RepID=A0AAU6SAM5_9MICO